MKLSRRMLVLLLVPVMGAMCQQEATPEDGLHVITGPVSVCDVVSPQNAKHVVGDTVRYTAVPCERAAGTFTYVWRTGNPTIVEIDSIGGLLRAKSVGSASVIATRVQDPSIKTGVVIEVSARP